MAACGDHNDPVSSNRTAAGLHASASGGTSGSSGPAADLQISGSASTGSPFTDSLFVYTFQIKNVGPDSAPDATFVDTLPPSLTFASVTLVNTGGVVLSQPGAIIGPISITPFCTQTLTPTNVVALCDVGFLKKSGSVTIQVSVVAPDSPGPISNTAHAVSSFPDPSPANNSVTINVQAQAAKPAKVNPTPTPPPPTPVPTVAFSTLPAEQFGGYVFAGGPSGVGFEFTPTVSGPMVNLITATEASGGGKSEFWIYNDNPLNPDNPGTLYFGPMFGVIQSTFALDIISFPKGGPPLVAGQKYWLFGFGVTGELSGLWHLSSNVLATTPCASGPFPGIGVEPGAACRYPAFQISVLH